MWILWSGAMSLDKRWFVYLYIFRVWNRPPKPKRLVLSRWGNEFRKWSCITKLLMLSRHLLLVKCKFVYDVFLDIMITMQFLIAFILLYVLNTTMNPQNSNIIFTFRFLSYNQSIFYILFSITSEIISWSRGIVTGLAVYLSSRQKIVN